MALKVLMLRKKIDSKRKELEALRAKDADFEKREAELETAIGEAETEEEQNAVTEEIETFNEEREAHDSAKADLESEIGELEGELEAEERAQEVNPPATKEPEDKREKGEKAMTPEVRNRFGLTQEFVTRENVQEFLSTVRTCIKEKRALPNVGLTIPQEFLGYIRQNVPNYSKLYRHVNVRPIGGEGRMVVMGAVPEAIWTECCARLNEISLGFNDVEVDCNKLGAFFAVCNAILEDSDLNLASELIAALSQAIGLALDKAILYGTGSKMPLGIVTRLAQTSEPGSYPNTARQWVDYHSTHVLTIANTVTGVDLFKTIMLDAAVASGKYSRGEKVWVMNETTYTFLKAQGLSINAAGAIVSGVEGTMPVVGGIVEVLDFVPDYNIIGGYLDLYLLAERAGVKIDQSTEYRFVEDQTVFKGTARYDGVPVIAEAFVVIGVNGTSPSTTASFEPDDANTVQGIILNKNSAFVAKDHTIKLVANTIPEGAEVSWTSSNTDNATVSGGVVSGVAVGSAVITASAGNATAVCNITVTTT